MKKPQFDIDNLLRAVNTAAEETVTSKRPTPSTPSATASSVRRRLQASLPNLDALITDAPVQPAEDSIAQANTSLDSILSGIDAPLEHTPVSTAPSTRKNIRSLMTGLQTIGQSVDSAVQDTVAEVKSWPLERKREEAKRSTNPHVLETLADDPDKTIAVRIALNPHVPRSLLKKLAESGSNHAKEMVAQHPLADEDIITILVETCNYGVVKSAILRRADISPVLRFKLEKKK